MSDEERKVAVDEFDEGGLWEFEVVEPLMTGNIDIRAEGFVYSLHVADMTGDGIEDNDRKGYLRTAPTSEKTEATSTRTCPRTC